MADEWVARLSNANSRESAIAELTTLLVRGVSSALSKRYGATIDAEDLVQDAILKILDSLDDFRGDSKFTSWAMTIAIRVGVSELRRKRYQDVSLETTVGDGLKVKPPTHYDSVERKFDRAEIEEQLAELIDSSLNDRQQTAVRALLEGMPVEVIAEKFGVNRNAVYKMFHDARSKLRRGFERTGVSADDVASAITSQH